MRRNLESSAVAGLALSMLTASTGCSGCHAQPAVKAQAQVRQQASARAAAAPRPPPLPTRSADGSYTSAGLRYLEIVTGGAKQTDSLPLIAFFHPLGGDPERDRVAFASFPDKARIVLAFGKQGPKGGYEWFPNHALRDPAMQGAYARAIPVTEAQVARGLDAISKAWPTTGKPIISGFSQGAGLTYAIALRHPDLVSYACPFAGELPAETLKVPSPPVKPEIHGIHGDSDSVVAIREGKRTIGSFKALGYVADIQVIHGCEHKFEPAESAIFACLDRAVRAVAKKP